MIEWYNEDNEGFEKWFNNGISTKKKLKSEMKSEMESQQIN